MSVVSILLVSNALLVMLGGATRPRFFVRQCLDESFATVKLDWKAVQYTPEQACLADDIHVAWEMRRIYKTIYSDRKSIQMSDILLEETPGLTDAFAGIGLEWRDEHIPSRDSCRRRGLDLAWSDQEHMISTRGMVAMLQHWRVHKVMKRHKMRAHAMLQVVLSNGIPEDFADDLPITGPPLECRPLCVLGVDAGGLCACVRAVLAEWPTQNRRATVVKVLERFDSLHPLGPCMAMSAWYCLVLQRVSVAIDQNIDEWCECDPLEVGRENIAIAGPKKKMRIDYHLREAISIAGLQDGLAATSASLCRARGLASAGTASGWDERICSELLAATMLQIPLVGSVWFPGDGGRFGRPAEENHVMFGWESISNRGFVLPPMVHHIIVRVLTTIIRIRIYNCSKFYIYIFGCCKMPLPPWKRHFA